MPAVACHICKKPNCYEHCQEDRNGQHKADWQTVALADRSDPTPQDGEFIFDVWCTKCGQSGSFSVNVKESEVQWA